MDEFKIIWTQTAVNQRQYIFNYWNNRNKGKNYSRKLNLAIRERISMLKSHPEIGKETDLKDIRVISMRHYSILYRIKERVIFITGFWDNRQDPEKLLKFLKNK